MSFRHIPVMVSEVLNYLDCRPGKTYVDGTVGGAGHAKAICARIVPDGLLIGIDQDQAALQQTQKILKPYAPHVNLMHGNFSRLPDFLAQLGLDAVDGILLDLGLSLYQIESSGRGFSFKRDEPLDMRMDQRGTLTAGQLLAEQDEKSLTRIFRKYGEEKWAQPIARRIVRTRRNAAIRTSKQLAELIVDTVPKSTAYRQRIHPATRVFMALRIAVNQELQQLDRFLETAPDILNPGGRLCVLSYHSLEDRMVKHRMRDWATACVCPPDLPQCACDRRQRADVLTKKVVRPSAAEIAQNPMARSAKLRAACKR